MPEGESLPTYVTNYRYADGSPSIRDRTHHRLRDRTGRRATAVCGAQFHAEEDQYTDDPDDLRERHKCRRCFRDGVNDG